MKRTQENSILWVEATGFTLLIIMTVLSEAVGIPHLIFGENFIPNWHRALLRIVVILLVWAWVHLVTRRLLKRLHYLEDFLRICGWCRKVCHNDQWLQVEDYFTSKFATPTSHGMCPSCLEKNKAEIATAKYPPDPKPDFR